MMLILMKLILARKSATAGRQAAAGTTGVVAIVETGGKSPIHQIFATGVIDTCGKKIMATILDYLNLKVNLNKNCIYSKCELYSTTQKFPNNI